MRTIFMSRLHVVILMSCFMAAVDVANAATDTPETVMITYQPKPNQEQSLIKVLENHWQVAKELNLVSASPHMVLLGGEGKKHFIVEVFTWRDASIPDNAPRAISELWRDMNELVEMRDGKPGLEFQVVDVVKNSP